MPIRNFYDRGIPEKLDEDPTNFPLLIRAYKTASRRQVDDAEARRRDQAEAGRRLARRCKLLCVCASGEVIADEPGSQGQPDREGAQAEAGGHQRQRQEPRVSCSATATCASSTWAT